MEFYHPVKFDFPSAKSIEPVIPETPITKPKDEEGGLNLKFFMSEDAVIDADPVKVEAELENRRKKSTRKTINKSELPSNMVQIQNNQSMAYADSYNETSAVLKTAIAQSDQLLGEIKQDIDAIRASKTLKGKYTYLTNLTSSAANLINTRITAASRINDTITKAHELELRRAKDIKDSARDDKNDDARMMDLYNAFINNPIGMYDNKLNMPTIPAMTLGADHAMNNIMNVAMGTAQPQEALTPEQMRMRMEGNTNVQEVVKYDPSTGRRWFEAVDMVTNQPVPNYPISDQFLLENTQIDVRGGLAKNRDLDRVWPLVTVGEVNEY